MPWCAFAFVPSAASVMLCAAFALEHVLRSGRSRLFARCAIRTLLFALACVGQHLIGRADAAQTAAEAVEDVVLWLAPDLYRRSEALNNFVGRAPSRLYWAARAEKRSLAFQWDLVAQAAFTRLDSSSLSPAAAGICFVLLVGAVRFLWGYYGFDIQRKLVFVVTAPMVFYVFNPHSIAQAYGLLVLSVCS